MLIRLEQISAHFGIVKPQKEVHTQSRNQGIFLQFWQSLSNGAPLRLKLVAVGEGPYFNFVSFTSQSATLRRLITTKPYLFTLGQMFNPSSTNKLELGGGCTELK